MIDTHTHLYLPEFDGDDNGASAITRAINLGVEHFIFPNVDLSTVEPMHRLAKRYPDNISCAMGLHPTEIRENWEDTLHTIFNYLGNDKSYVAIGEIGIDLYWDRTFRESQMQAFSIQVAKACELSLPVIIHCREGLNETLEVLQDYPEAKAVFHSFGGTTDDVERIRKQGDLYFGINGIVTFKNSKLRDVLPSIGIDHILLETDSPYLAPVPYRGKRNESSFLPHIAAHIARTLDMSLPKVDEITTENAKKLFKKVAGHI